MSVVIYVLSGVAGSLIGVLELAMYLRAILSWFALEDNRFESFLCAITEPFVFPLRKLFDKMDWFTDSPLDIPFFLTLILLSFLSILL